MSPLDAFAALQIALGTEKHAARVLDARHAFEQRSGPFGPEDAWFEGRSRAFWDDALTSGGLGMLAADDVPADARAWIGPLSRAHRGLFELAGGDGLVVVRDLVGGAELIVDEVDPGTRDALHALGSASAPFDGRIVAGGAPLRTALLPGAIFHPDDARSPILTVLEAARARNMPRTALLDALLRMELSLRRLSRVKASYAYRL